MSSVCLSVHRGVPPNEVPGEDPSHVPRQGWGWVDPSEVTGPVPGPIWEP